MTGQFKKVFAYLTGFLTVSLRSLLLKNLGAFKIKIDIHVVEYKFLFLFFRIFVLYCEWGFRVVVRYFRGKNPPVYLC